MDFSDLLKNRRSVRAYQNKEVSLDVIGSIIKESILAPNAGNQQPCKFIIVKNKEMIQEISDEGKRNILNRIASDPNDYAKRYEKMLQDETFHIFYHAPAVVFILGEANLKNLFADCALAASYLMMSATSKGLGTCWVNFGAEINDPELRNKLGLAENYKIVAPIALGYPAKIPEYPKRKEPEILKVIE